MKHNEQPNSTGVTFDSLTSTVREVQDKLTNNFKNIWDGVKIVPDETLRAMQYEVHVSPFLYEKLKRESKNGL